MKLTKKEALALVQLFAFAGAIRKIKLSDRLLSVNARLEEYLTESVDLENGWGENQHTSDDGDSDDDEDAREDDTDNEDEDKCEECDDESEDEDDEPTYDCDCAVSMAELLDLKPLTIRGGSKVEFDTAESGKFYLSVDGYLGSLVAYVKRTGSKLFVGESPDQMDEFNVSKFPRQWIDLLPTGQVVKVTL